MANFHMRGFAKGKSGKYADMYAGWNAQKGKPKKHVPGFGGEPTLSGKYIEAQETFYEGFLDGKRHQQNNPSKRSLLKKLRKGIRGTVKISHGRLIIKT